MPEVSPLPVPRTGPPSSGWPSRRAIPAVGFSEHGFTMAGQAAHLPVDNPLVQTLKEHGITVTYLAPVDDPNGITSPGLMIRQQQKVFESRTVVLTYTVGRTVAHVS